MNIISDPLFYLIAIPAVLLYGMAKGGLGPALGAITVPAMSLVINPLEAAAIMLPILCVMDIFAVWNFRKSFDVGHLKVLLPGAVVGITIASLLMGQLSADAIRLIIGIIAVAFCLNYWIGGKIVKERKGGKISGLFWGAMSGFTSTQIHAGGPPLAVYILPQKLDRLYLMGTMAIFFVVVNYIKLIPYTILGAFDASNLTTSLILMPLAPIGVRIGYLILHRIPQMILYRFLYIVLFLSGLKLLYDGIF